MLVQKQYHKMYETLNKLILKHFYTFFKLLVFELKV